VQVQRPQPIERPQAAPSVADPDAQRRPAAPAGAVPGAQQGGASPAAEPQRRQGRPRGCEPGEPCPPNRP
jgi:hypothetical protein